MRLAQDTDQTWGMHAPDGSPRVLVGRTMIEVPGISVFECDFAYGQSPQHKIPTIVIRSLPPEKGKPFVQLYRTFDKGDWKYANIVAETLNSFASKKLDDILNLGFAEFPKPENKKA